jgi:DNA topoisomerase IA
MRRGPRRELIFRLIAQNAKAKQPVKRLWLQSMTPGAIREGFRPPVQRRRDDAAGRCRTLPLGSGLADRH